MPDAHKNFAYGTVLTAPSPATSGTSLVLNGGQGALMPATPFNASVWPVGAQPTAANAEVVLVTAVATDTLTITRAQEGSPARTVVAGDQFAAAITARTLDELEGAMTPADSRQVRAGYCQILARPLKVVPGVTITIQPAGKLVIIG